MATQNSTTKNAQNGAASAATPPPHAGPARRLAARPDRIQMIRPQAAPRAASVGSLGAALSRTMAPMVVGVPALALLAAAAPVAPLLVGVQVMSLAAVGGYLALHAFQATDDLVLAHQTRAPQETADRTGYTALGRFVAAARAAQGHPSRLIVADVPTPAPDLSFPPRPVAEPVGIPSESHPSDATPTAPLFRPPTIRPPIPR